MSGLHCVIGFEAAVVEKTMWQYQTETSLDFVSRVLTTMHACMAELNECEFPRRQYMQARFGNDLSWQTWTDYPVDVAQIELAHLTATKGVIQTNRLPMRPHHARHHPH